PRRDFDLFTASQRLQPLSEAFTARATDRGFDGEAAFIDTHDLAFETAELVEIDNDVLAYVDCDICRQRNAAQRHVADRAFVLRAVGRKEAALRLEGDTL